MAIITTVGVTVGMVGMVGTVGWQHV